MSNWIGEDKYWAAANRKAKKGKKDQYANARSKRRKKGQASYLQRAQSNIGKAIAKNEAEDAYQAEFCPLHGEFTERRDIVLAADRAAARRKAF